MAVGERTVLQLLGPSTGGIRRHVAELASMLPTLGWQVRIAGPLGVGEGTDLPTVVPVPVPSGPNPRQLLRAGQALRHAAAGVDLVHAHGLKAGWVAGLARVGVPVAVTVHNLVLDETSGMAAPLLRAMEGRLPRRVDGVIAVSPEIADRFGGDGLRLWTIPPAGPTPCAHRSRAVVRQALGVAEDAPLVVCVARLHPQKGLETLLEAAVTLQALVPGARLVIVGEGPLEGTLQQQIQDRDLAGTVVLAGPSANAADEMAAADVVVVSSLWESGPLVAAEALQLGRPLVATPVGFVPRLADAGADVALVPIGDAAAMARALASALRAPALQSDDRAVRRLLAPERLVGEVAGVYDRLLAARQASR